MHWYIPGTACWWPKTPKPPCIGAAPPDAQAVDGVCWPVHTGQGRDARRASLVERTVAKGSTTAHLRVVSKCALREGRQRERSAQAIPGGSRFGSLLLVNHRLSSLCHSATNEPSANVYLGGETTLYTIHLSTVLCTGWDFFGQAARLCLALCQGEGIPLGFPLFLRAFEGRKKGWLSL